jgi:prepilin-type N-terminal cleavage/methylation domain-containing protein
VVSRARQRGITLLEIVVALAVVVVLVGAAMGGVRAHAAAVGRSWTRLEASRAAASRLEEVRSDPRRPAPGTTPFEPRMEGATGLQRVREVASGVQEVEVEVVHAGDGVRVALTTWIAREGPP